MGNRPGVPSSSTLTPEQYRFSAWAVLLLASAIALTHLARAADLWFGWFGGKVIPFDIFLLFVDAGAIFLAGTAYWAWLQRKIENL